MSKKIHNKTLNKSKTSVRRVLSDLSVSTEHFSSKQNLTLYRFVYATKASFFVSLMLLGSFFVQGVQNVYANELTSEMPTELVNVTVDDVSADEEFVSVPNSVPELNDESADFTESVTGGSEEEIVSDLLIDQAVVTIDDDLETIETNQTIEAHENDAVTDEAAPATEPNADVIESDDNTIDAETEPASDTTVEDEEVLAEVEEVITNDDIELNHEAISISESDSAFSFTSDECTQLATGSFYCQKPQKNLLQDALFSAPDEDGDTEIFLVREGVQYQITNNRVDDAAPYFDQNSNSIVWHRLIDDRYQIISYDVESQEERQITQTSSNNMEPTRQGDYTVWQRWVDGGWNIILHDGDKETQITRTTSHNVAPYIHGSLIVWNRQSAGGDKTIEMYDMVSKTYVSVDDPDGMSVSNPRMVFVYDSLHPNGDIVTRGYDVLARKFIDLDTLPISLPDEIPDSESTGETRAMIQSKPSIKSEISTVSGSSTNPVIDLPLDEVIVTSTSTDSLTLDLSDPEIIPAEEVEETVPTEISTQISIPDLVIESYVQELDTDSDTVQE
jgi:hypothetical protein